VSRSILVADDDPLVLEMATAVLGTGGYEVVTALDGEQALQMAEALPLRAAVLDQNMPGMSGLEVTRRLRARLRTADLPILICTADNARETVLAAKRYRANTFLVKPFSPDALLARVKQLVRPTGSVWS
jgi:CheY-like chemotaxis protein